MAPHGYVPHNFIDLTGKRFVRLLVIRQANATEKWVARWLCQCDCGKQVSVASAPLRKGETKSCGCLRSDVSRRVHRVHGKSKTPEWEAWVDMRERCASKGHTSYKNYGGRGITVCAEWDNSFDAFFADIGPKPTPSHSLDRIDVNGNYEPGNVKWSTLREQSLNKRSTVRVIWNGALTPLFVVAESLGLNPAYAVERFRTKKNLKRALRLKELPPNCGVLP